MPGLLFQSVFWSLYLSSVISGEAVQREPPQLIGPATALPISLDAIPPTDLILPHNASTLGDVFDITCDGSRFGYIDDGEDCASALLVLASATRVVTFAERHTAGITADMYPLPWRWMGSMILKNAFFTPLDTEIAARAC